jgi:hypothetical protein
VIGFFNTYRQLYPVSRDVLRDIAGQFQNWVKNRSERWGAPILEALKADATTSSSLTFEKQSRTKSSRAKPSAS